MGAAVVCSLVNEPEPTMGPEMVKVRLEAEAF
jgi:hypothetical protein